MFSNKIATRLATTGTQSGLMLRNQSRNFGCVYSKQLFTQQCRGFSNGQAQKNILMSMGVSSYFTYQFFTHTQ